MSDDDDQFSLFGFEGDGCTCPSDYDYDPQCPRHSPKGGAAVARKGDPSTSHEAAERTSKKMREKQQAVLRVLARIGPSTDIELVDKYAYHIRERGEPEQSGSGIRTRRDELRRQGFVVDTGLKRRTPSGNNAIVWAARDKAGDVMMEPGE